MNAEPVAQTVAPPGAHWRLTADSYLNLIARGRNSGWRTLAGCTLILAAWIVLSSVLYFLFEAQFQSGKLGQFVAVNLGILVLLAGLVLAVVWVQRRPLLTLVTPRERFDLRRAGQGFGVFTVLAGIAFAVESALYPGRYTLNALNGDAGQWWVFAPVILLLTPLQAATEELLFRGYLMQSLRTFTRSPLLIVITSSLLFMVPHLLNPEAEHGGVLVAVQYLLLAIFFAVITLRDGRLELAIGAHAANNIFIAIVATYPNSALDTPAIFIADTLDPVFSLISLIVGSGLFYGWFFLRRAP